MEPRSTAVQWIGRRSLAPILPAIVALATFATPGPATAKSAVVDTVVTNLVGTKDGGIYDATASCFARIANEEFSASRKLRQHAAWIAATALRH